LLLEFCEEAHAEMVSEAQQYSLSGIFLVDDLIAYPDVFRDAGRTIDMGLLLAGCVYPWERALATCAVNDG
jgi:hypothetical protein